MNNPRTKQKLKELNTDQCLIEKESLNSHQIHKILGSWLVLNIFSGVRYGGGAQRDLLAYFYEYMDLR
jgi:hypothetical protein